MKKIGVVLILSSISMFLFCSVYHITLKDRKEEDITNYIEETKINEEIESPEIVEEKKEQTNNTINYTSILEIQSINLKEGLVNNTKNFNSVNYAVSIDKQSNYPDKMGNFILYAHSGNSNIAFFKKLYKVKLDDEICVYYNGIKYCYKVIDKYSIDKTGKADVISTNSDKYITLITCNQQEKGKQIVLIGKITNEFKY